MNKPSAAPNDSAAAFPVAGRASARINLWLPWLVLAVSLALTYQLWRNAQRDAALIQRAEFESRASEVASDIEQRMQAYDQVLRGVSGLFTQRNTISRKEFHDYFANLLLQQRFSGIQGVGYAQIIPRAQKQQHIAAIRSEGFPGYDIKPAGERDIYTSVVYLEPADERNRRALGYDMYSDLAQPREGDAAAGLRHAAMDHARDTGMAAVSGRVRLLMEHEGDSDAQPGFLMYLPVYRHGAQYATLAERRANIVGWVYAPFRMRDLMTEILGAYSIDLDINIHDGTAASEHALMFDFDYGASHGGPSKALFQITKHVDVPGRQWTLVIRSRPPFEARAMRQRAKIIAYAGMGMSLLLALLTWLLVHGRVLAVQEARRLNRELIQRTAELHKLSTAVEQSPISVMITDADARIQYVNPQFTATTGYTAEEAIGRHSRMLKSGQTPQETYRQIWAQVTSRQTWHGELLNRRKNGELYWEENHIAPVTDSAGAICNYVCLKIDVTERIASKQALEHLSMLYKMQSEINAANIQAGSRDKLFDAVCRIAVSSGRVTMACITVLDQATGDVEAGAQAGHTGDLIGNIKMNIYHGAYSDGPTARAIRSGQHQVSRDVANDPALQQWREILLEHGYRAFAIFPLFEQGQVIGTFNLCFNEPGLLSDDVIQLLKGIADDMSFALGFMAEIRQRERLQAGLHDLSMFLQSALENERKRIARELHDELGQTMTALRFDLKWLFEHVKAQDDDVYKKIHSMRNLVGRTVDSIRRISEDLRPGMLDDLGLAAAIEHHVVKFSEKTGIECSLFMSDADFDLDDPVATALFRIVQESLTNVARHSGATHVTVRLQELGDKMLLIVQDNGRGLPAAQAGAKKTYGLMGMRERVKMLSGTLDIFNEAGAGARIEACVPKRVIRQGAQ